MAKIDKKVSRIVIVGLMAALVFAASMISIPLPTIAGTPTRIHLGNVICLLSALLFGGLYGGLPSGIGSLFYDLTNPLYAPECWITFINKFAMGFVCGVISHGGGAKGKSLPRNIIGAIAGQLTYIVLYLGKTTIEYIMLGNAKETIIAAIAQKAAASSINGAIAVIIAVPLAAAIRAALMRVSMFREFVGE